MSKKYYSVQNKTKESVDILIYGVIGDSWYDESVTARQFVADLKALENDYTRINVRINSPGGSVFDGLPIFNAIRSSKAEIHTYNDGLCASMAAVILLAGKTVHSADNALMMLHSPISGCYGNASDFEQVMDMLDKVQDSLIACITSRDTSKTSDEIKAAYFDRKDHWLSADEAKGENFVDEIETGSKKVSNKVKDMDHTEIMNQFDSLVKGRGLLNSFFTKAHDFFSPNSEIDMDIKILAKACGLSDKATEQEVLDWIKEHGKPVNETEEAEETEEEESTEEEEETEETTEPDAKDQEIENLKLQVANLKKGPGAKDKKVVKSTDSKKTATNDFEVYQSARETLDAVTSLLK